MAKRAKKAAPSKPRTRRVRPRYLIVELATFEGEDTACYVLGADPMWIVISASSAAGAAIVDCGYRSLEEARQAWPEAIPPVAPPQQGGKSARFGWNRIPAVVLEPWFQELWKRVRAPTAPST
jgi:hypothetical protein